MMRREKRGKKKNDFYNRGATAGQGMRAVVLCRKVRELTTMTRPSVVKTATHSSMFIMFKIL